MSRTDIVIIGAGVIGLSIAYHLAYENKNTKITVVDKEVLPGMGSTAQCTGGIRHQFTSMLNVELTNISYPYFKKLTGQTNIPVFFRPRGYLLCTSSEDMLDEFNIIMQNLENAGIDVSLLSASEIKKHYPFLNTEDLLGATFCPHDAYADPGNVVQAYEKLAAQQGVEIRLNEEVQEILTEGGRIKGIITSQDEITAPIVVNAAGPAFTRLASTAGLELPARPYRRQVYVCSSMEDIPAGTPMVVDMDTGFYTHVEKNGTLLLGGTDSETSPGESTAVDWSALDDFIEKAVHRVPALDNAELIRAYVGIRSITPDYHGIVGESKKLPGFFLAGGFGGLGFMHAPAIGMIASDLITYGRTKLVNPRPLSPDRFDTLDERQENIVF